MNTLCSSVRSRHEVFMYGNLPAGPYVRNITCATYRKFTQRQDILYCYYSNQSGMDKTYFLFGLIFFVIWTVQDTLLIASRATDHGKKYSPSLVKKNPTHDQILCIYIFMFVETAEIVRLIGIRSLPELIPRYL